MCGKSASTVRRGGSGQCQNSTLSTREESAYRPLRIQGRIIPEPEVNQAVHRYSPSLYSDLAEPDHS
ncbi:MAG: hypothetical protein ACP5NL_07710 [Thermoplasmata archaeon]